MTNKFHDYTYLDMVQDIMEDGEYKGDRTGTGTQSLAFQQMRFDLSDMSIPMLTTKKMFVRGIIHELLWYIAGDTNIQYLTDNNVHIWDEWADENGDLGPVYGAQWRNCDGVDQLSQMIEQLRTNPNDRRILLDSWNVRQIPEMRLPPCHLLMQCWTNGKGELRTHLYQRSCDTGLGVPFNIVQYSILTHMIAQVTGHKAVEFVWTGGDVHIYNNHRDAMTEQLGRIPTASPQLQLNPDVAEITNFTYDDFQIIGYESHGPLKMDVSV